MSVLEKYADSRIEFHAVTISELLKKEKSEGKGISGKLNALRISEKVKDHRKLLLMCNRENVCV